MVVGVAQASSLRDGGGGGGADVRGTGGNAGGARLGWRRNRDGQGWVSLAEGWDGAHAGAGWRRGGLVDRCTTGGGRRVARGSAGGGKMGLEAL